jgi:lysophospholipase L1-like esterase
MPQKFAALAALLVVALLVPAAAQARAKTRYYVSLGDSLAVGFQPDAVTGKGATTKQGYVDDLYKLEKRKIPGLVSQKFGCAGEDTHSISTNSSACSYGRFGSQLQAAEAFLRQHRGQVAFVTIDIGANDVDGCAKGTHVDATCLNNGLASSKRNIPVVAKRLRRAAGPKVQIVGMNYYDPFLELYTSGDATGRSLAQASIALGDQFNQIIASAYKAGKVKIADVATAFQTDNFSSITTLAPFGSVPVDVARVCQLTWMCKPAPVGPNIHANAAGYSLIANTFAKQITAR